MRVLLVNDYATLRGGAEILTFALRDALRERGHDARLFASSAGGGDGADYTCTGTTGRWRTLLQSWNPGAARRLRAVLRDFKPDIAHVRMFLTQLSPSILSPLRGVPSLAHVVWYRPVCPTGSKLLPDDSPCQVRAGRPCRTNRCLPLRDWIPLMFQRRWQRRGWPAFDMTIANSGAVRAELERDGLAVDAVVPNGVPECAERTELAADPTATFAGRLVREKGVDVLLRAFAALATNVERARLVIAGDGPDAAALKSLAHALGIDDRVTWVGHSSSAELAAMRAGSWVDVAPSVWAEPFGLTVIEAMMAGIAVVASASGGPCDTVVDGETGLLVEPGNATTLAAALTRCLSDRDLAERWGRAGRQRALARFTATMFYDRIEELYERLRRR